MATITGRGAITLYRDMEHGGGHQIPFRTLDEQGLPYANKRVFLLDILTSCFVQRAISDTNGEGAFRWVSGQPGRYIIVACHNYASDGAMDYPAVGDFLTPGTMD